MTDSHDVPATAPLDQAGLVQRLSHGFARLLGFGEDAKQLTTEGTEGTKEKATAGEDPQAAFIAQRDRFKAAFGPKGLDYLADGLTFEEAQEAHAAGEKADLEKRLTDLTKERDELKEKLSQIDRGEKDPADFQAEDGSEAAAAQFQGALGEKLAPLAAQNARALSN